jgi:hypothetical protein
MSPVIRVSDQNYERLKAWVQGWETQDETIGRVLDAAGHPTALVGPPIPNDSARLKSEYDAWFASRSEASGALYATLVARLDEVGDGIEIGKAPTYVKLMVVGFNFAELAPRSRGLQVVVHSNGFGLDYGETSIWEDLHVKRRSAKAANTLDIEIEVDIQTNLDSVIKALRNSYQTIRLRHSHG